MKRLVAILTLLAVSAVFVVLATGADDGEDGGYRVRAIFRNAFSVIPGEDVKIAGVRVGKIESLDVTDDNHAAVVLLIEEPGFQDFRKDATCTIRPQSLIGEKFVECTPTQPRAEGDEPAPKLAKIEEGEGKGQHLLPVEQTRRPIDIDLLNNIMRRPYAERFSIILNELGVGLASRGEDLNEAIKQANPALMELDKVLAILAEQNEVLADLASEGDRALAPLARDRNRVASFIEEANETAQASAERREDIEANFERFPRFLQELRPTMTRLGALADEMTPVLTDLGQAAPEISQFVRQLGPFSQAGIPAFESLGDAADVGRDALLASRPRIRDLREFAKQGKPLTKNLGDLLVSLRDTGGVERLMDFIFFQAAAINGFDSVGHYLRAVAVVTTCQNYVIENDISCTANFQQPEASAARASAASKGKPDRAWFERELAKGRTPALVKQEFLARGGDKAVLSGEDRAAGEAAERVDGAAGEPKASTKAKAGAKGGRAGAKLALPTFLPGQQPEGRGEAPKAAKQMPQPTSEQGAEADPSSTLLDYLLGS